MQVIQQFKSRLLLVGGSLVLVACAPEKSIAPTAVPSESAGYGLQMDASYMVADQMSFTEEGITYTLNGATSQITTSTGKAVMLTPEQVAEYASHFQDAINGESTVVAVDTSGGPIDFEPYRLGGDAPERPLRIRFSQRPLGGPSSGRHTGTVSILSGDYCGDLEVAVYNNTKSFNSARRSWVRALDAVLTIAQDGITSGSIPNIPEAGFAVVTYVARSRDMMSAWNRLNILATQYKAYGCWKTSWGSSGFGADAAGLSSIGASRLVCTWETAWVSINGGPAMVADVLRCEYKLFSQ